MSTTAARPAVYGTEEFISYCTEFLAEWLADFTWNDVPVAQSLRTIRVRPEQADQVEGSPESAEPWTTLFDRPSTEPASKPTPTATDWSEEMQVNPFHRAWIDVLNEYRLAGTWIHPDVMWETDPYVWATTGGTLPIGTRDRETPDQPRRFDPNLASWSNDIGVVNFPLHAQYQVPEMINQGYSAERACRYTVLSAVVAAGVHESLEMLQSSPGQPLWDPHDRRYFLAVTVEFADGAQIETSAR